MHDGLLQIVVHFQVVIGEILFMEHVVAQFQMTGTDGKHHSVCEQHPRRVEGSRLLIIVHIGSENLRHCRSGRIRVGFALVAAHDGEQVGELILAPP